MKTIAIDLDDTLNNFTQTLQQAQFVRDETYALSEEVYQDHLAKLRCGWTENGRSSKYGTLLFQVQNPPAVL